MYSHKIIINLLLLYSACLLIGCATTYAPDGWLPETDAVPEFIYGGWITLETEPDSLGTEQEWLQYSGEFISVDSLNVYLLYDSLYVIPKSKIANSLLELDEKSTTGYGIWVVFGTLSTLSNGVYSAITAPLWLIFGIPSAAGESYRDRYEAEPATEEYWESIRIFARFPQGISNIELTTIKLVFNLNDSD